MSPDIARKLESLIRDVPDFPKPGIVFKDITTLLRDADGFSQAVGAMAAPWAGVKLTRVVSVESRGFIFGAAIARELGLGMVPVRKPGKLPWRTRSASYSLEYGTDTLEMHEDAVGAGDSVIVVDDLLATGGTAAAAVRLARESGADVVGASFLIELEFLGGRARLADVSRVESLLKYG